MQSMIEQTLSIQEKKLLKAREKGIWIQLLIRLLG